MSSYVDEYSSRIRLLVNVISLIDNLWISRDADNLAGYFCDQLYLEKRSGRRLIVCTSFPFFYGFFLPFQPFYSHLPRFLRLSLCSSRMACLHLTSRANTGKDTVLVPLNGPRCVWKWRERETGSSFVTGWLRYVTAFACSLLKIDPWTMRLRQNCISLYRVPSSISLSAASLVNLNRVKVIRSNSEIALSVIGKSIRKW